VQFIDGSFVVHEGKVHKVPGNNQEALESGLMGLFEKRRCRKFLMYVSEFNPQNPKSFDGTRAARFLGLTMFTVRSQVSTP
jgi:Rab GDP dissociation inhibitor